MNAFRWHMPTEVVLEAGCVDSLEARCHEYGTRPLLVTGRHSAKQSGALDRVCAQYPDAVVFDEVEENPCTETCDAGAAVCRKAHCDFVIGIGGGSPMDAAKAIAMLACNPGVCEDYYGKGLFNNGNLPIVAVPTTAGTGSEVTPNAVITHHAQQFKRSIAGPTLFPKLALLDPELSVSMPPAVTAHTGLDALSQVMEGMVSRNATPMGDGLALDVCRIVRQWLPRAVHHPRDLEARQWMLYAAMVSGCIIAQSGTTLVHGMGYYFTLAHGLSHGLANALLLIPLFRHNAAHVPEKVAAIATALGHPADPTPDAATAQFTQAIETLACKVNVPLAGKEVGVERDALRGFATSIYADKPRFKNQVGDLSEEDVYALFRQAYEGSY